MERTWRWFGKKDKITLAQLKQIGVEGIVTALHDVPLGEVWTREKIHDLKTYIESYGMRWSVVESLPVVETIIIKTQGFVSGNFSENDEAPIQKFRDFLDLYKGIDKAQLRANMKYFLEAIMPTCEEFGMNMCVHPDDPPIEVLGLPRIIRTEEDIEWFLNAVPNKHNGLTFCAGSLSAGAYNNVVEMAKKFASRTHFVHLRSCHIFPNGDFTEASHLGGRADLIELCRIFEQENPQLPMRVDHGMTFTDEPGGIFDESNHGHNSGYTLLGRMFAMGQVQGILATVDRELGIEYKQPGFFD